MKQFDVEALIGDVEQTLDEPRWYVYLYWQGGADEHEVVSLVQKNWSSLSEPCTWERAFSAVAGIRENEGDAVMLSASSEHDAEQLVMQAIRLGARSALDD